MNTIKINGEAGQLGKGKGNQKTHLRNLNFEAFNFSSL
jgi:hypothetical protein